jgi:hypothetical protein
LRYTQPHDESIALGGWIEQIASLVAADSSTGGRNSMVATVPTTTSAGATLLGTAVCAFSLHLLGKMHRDEQVIAQSRTLYGRALRYLQWSLDHPTEWSSPETLGASAILCFFEVK